VQQEVILGASNSTLYIDIYTGSNDDFYLRREFSGSNANVTGSEVTSSAIILGNANMIHFEENLDVSLALDPIIILDLYT
jgi:hypothetical protein